MRSVEKERLGVGFSNFDGRSSHCGYSCRHRLFGYGYLVGLHPVALGGCCSGSFWSLFKIGIKACGNFAVNMRRFDNVLEIC